MSEFDNIITQIEYSVSVTAADGTLNKKIASAISLAHQQAEWCTTTANAKQNDRLADRYRQLAKVAEDKAAAIQKNAEMVLSVNGDLAEMLPSIQEEKGLYYAAAVIGDLETANKSLVDVHRNMKKVVGLLSQLNRLDEQFNVPARSLPSDRSPGFSKILCASARGIFCVVKRLAPLPSFLPTPIPASSYRKSTDAAVDPKPRSRLWLRPRLSCRLETLLVQLVWICTGYPAPLVQPFFLTQGLVGRFLLQAFHRQFIRAFHVSPSFSSRVDREIWWAA